MFGKAVLHVCTFKCGKLIYLCREFDPRFELRKFKESFKSREKNSVKNFQILKRKPPYKM